ncbi:type II toxin-antitoxin system HicA family toxin [Pseudomonas kunmingensis]|uniref:type II toxin-antitoxin system HicA family toxin n=1 Tax=Stutzerimonas kunmingensis TaxID=1211807 RepID=UPI0015E2F7FC|nr:type II toxin-antitoxin system HicA family toxin [Stutzerimonas kunmingensis]MBA1238753.1 type II toxin-antitoxin system HicA family toxin [Stutzerimonas kunmingensis]
MSSVHDLYRGHKRLLPLIEFALDDGWSVSRTSEGHLKFVKTGLPPIFTSSTVSDRRVSQSAWAQLRRAERGLSGGQDD